MPPVNVWDAEHALDADQARQLLAAQFPQLALDSVEPFGVGFDNTVYLVDGEWAFRFPRREVAVPLMARELGLLPGLAPRLPLAVPVPELVGRPGGRLPVAVLGRPAGPRAGARRRRPAGRRPRLRSAPRSAASSRPCTSRPWPGTSAATCRTTRCAAAPRAPGARWRGTSWTGWPAAAAGEPGSATDRAVDEVIAAADPLAPPAGEPVVVHGDLHLRHLLVGADGTATGVIDWGDSCLADPAAGPVAGLRRLQRTARAALLAAYGRPVDEERELRARVLALALCSALADYADLEGHPALLVESLAGVGRAVA